LAVLVADGGFGSVAVLLGSLGTGASVAAALGSRPDALGPLLRYLSGAIPEPEVMHDGLLAIRRSIEENPPSSVSAISSLVGRIIDEPGDLVSLMRAIDIVGVLADDGLEARLRNLADNGSWYTEKGVPREYQALVEDRIRRALGPGPT